MVELRRIHLPRTPVNKGEKKEKSRSSQGNSQVDMGKGEVTPLLMDEGCAKRKPRPVTYGDRLRVSRSSSRACLRSLAVLSLLLPHLPAFLLLLLPDLLALLALFRISLPILRQILLRLSDLIGYPGHLDHPSLWCTFLFFYEALLILCFISLRSVLRFLLSFSYFLTLFNSSTERPSRRSETSSKFISS
jgi:hypothetical protein